MSCACTFFCYSAANGKRWMYTWQEQKHLAHDNDIVLEFIIHVSFEFTVFKINVPSQ